VDGAHLTLVEAWNQQRVHRSTDDRGFEHGARVETDRGMRVIERVE
jgi:hypothetical protein